MASYQKIPVTCSCCGKKFEARMLVGAYMHGNVGMDSNPHCPEIYDKVVQCPDCGYAAQDIQKPVSEAAGACMKSDSYQKLLREEGLPGSARKLLLAAMLQQADGNVFTAYRNYLMAAWALRDRNQDPLPAIQSAIENLSRYLEVNMDLESAVILVDLMRQSGDFAEAEETARSAMDFADGDSVPKLLNFELRLIQNKDTAPHLVREVLK